MLPHSRGLPITTFRQFCSPASVARGSADRIVRALVLRTAIYRAFDGLGEGGEPTPEDLAAIGAAFAAGLGRAQFAASARQAAEELLSDTDFAARVDQLPFAAGGTVVALGDSVTDDLQPWAGILRHLLDPRRSGDQIQVVNQGISGDTTAAALRRLVPILLTQPSWIICMLGTNDVQRNGLQATKTLVSLDETALNLAELHHLAATESQANWAWITAPPCDEELFAASPFWAQAAIIIRNDDLVAVADVLRDEPDPVVDLVTLFGQPAAAGLLMDDGVHPTLAGQQAIVRALVERLTVTA